MKQTSITQEVNLKEIPQELLNKEQWIAWKGEYKENGKVVKRPIDPNTGLYAKTNTPDTWSSFAKAFKHYRDNDLDGIGFVFSETDPYLGIDLDDCLDDGLSPEMETLVKSFNSYTEISPSGRGLHIIVKGKLPGRGLRKDKIEVYDKARFFTITGNRMANTPKQIAEREDAINLLYDKLLSPQTNDTGNNNGTEKSMPAGDTEKFKALWDGNYQDYHSQSEADLALCQLLTHYSGKNPEAIDKLFRNSGLYRPKWDEAHYSDGSTYGQTTIQKAIETSGNSRQEKPETSTQQPEFNRTDLGNAERLVYHFGDKIRYCHAWKTWFIWDGCRWCPDETNRIREFAKQTVRLIYHEAKKTEDDSKRQALAKHAVSSESESRIRSMVSLAQSDNQVAIKPDEFDCDRFLFNCLNGTLDLRTGRLFPHRKENYITKLAKIHFDPYAKCPQWMSFLNRIMDKNANLIEFLKRAVGYSLTGDVSEQCLFIFFGSGANGKSTFLRTIDMLMGDYGQQTATETLLVKQKGAIPNDIARLKGSRFITASEAEAEQRLAESLIKQMTGGDIISARFLHQEWFDFEPTYKIFLGTNHKPVIKGTDYAIWRRIKLVPFEVTIPENERDGKLLDKLRDELSGILSWAIQGCMEWQNSGLGIPQEVSAATDEYKNEMDIISDFINECCIESPGSRVLFRDLYQAYKNWCDENGDYPLKKNAFSRRLREKGYVQARIGNSGAKGWKGISLVEEFLPDQVG
ncbi:putative DNA primase/helicase [Desulfosalsimonas propionicica]|uniref:Putative DNA primase/helicase n=1 Tax=Desulfosalsimonas propionicica TaxID=332175 RepID=A0A7W0HLA6_9BACT|nr:phage/plasmid primase, P4 family [Desulfosalsimonas propionicica]MBA2882078.1 putative DNA primase/helicase [Desulfosalsimonas propionicica]